MLNKITPINRLDIGYNFENVVNIFDYNTEIYEEFVSNFMQVHVLLYR